MQKSSHTHKKDGSSVRPKSSMLEKAIRELEKMVAECELNLIFISHSDAGYYSEYNFLYFIFYILSQFLQYV